MRTSRAAAYVLPALVVNAGVQAALVLPDPVPSPSPLFLLGALLSAVVALAVYAVIVATSVTADRRSMTLALRARGVRFLLWTVALAVVVVLGQLVLAGIASLLVLSAAPYVPIAAMSVGRNPVAANLSAIGRRPLAYAGRLAVSVALGLVIYLQAALTTFFVAGAAASAITMCVWGLAAWWLTRLWASAFQRAQGAD